MDYRLHFSVSRTQLVRFMFFSIIFLMIVGMSTTAKSDDDDDDERSRDRDTPNAFSIDRAVWNSSRNRLIVRGSGTSKSNIKIVNAYSESQVLASRMVNRDGSWRVAVSNPNPVPCRVKAIQSDGKTAERNVSNAPADCSPKGNTNPPPPPSGGTSINSTSQNASAASSPVSMQPFINTNYRVLAANDLGMHCADLDYQVFSILPPFNVVHAQVIQRGTANSSPRIMDDNNINVYYSAASNPNDPALSSPAVSPIYKSNFWADPDGDGRTFGFDTYEPLYFGLLKPTDIVNPDVGLPVFDSVLLRACLQPYLDGTATVDETRAACAAGQQVMPGINAPFQSNDPIAFDRFDKDLNFFNELLSGLGLGKVVRDVNWFAADGIPITPVDDEGRSNAYPLMRIQAKNKTSGEILASTDIVLPVASEADCQGCHASALDCASVTINPALQCDGVALNRTSGWTVMTVDGDTNGNSPPGDTELERLLNTAKINILRVHDAKHGTNLDASRPVQCSTCHYTPALDLAQIGPTNGPKTDQINHISMSRAMHGHHGTLPANPDLPYNSATNSLFPDMPGPVGRSQQATNDILEKTCYTCHPGKRTKCLRGAMATGGVVCQDCHGQSRHVGNDFSENFASTAWPAGANLNKRIPWASEPGCESCHTGDATSNLASTAGVPVAPDGIRLLQAYVLQAGQDASGASDGTQVAVPIKAVNKRFAENESLYRISKGHGGVMCEGCHGSTHAIFPNAIESANDNVASKQLQGHSGTIIECDTCHAAGSLGLTLNGPHGMHPVGDSNWNENHEDIAEDNLNSCRSCHGQNGEGTVLSRMSVTRNLVCDEGPGCGNNERITLTKGTMVGCGTCHENELRN